MLTSLPCVHEGVDRPDFDADSHLLAVRRRWHECNSPKQPLGPVVTGAMGCGIACECYKADADRARDLQGLAPLSVQRFDPLTPYRQPTFNGSIIRYAGKLFLAYRQGTGIRLATLDENYYAVGDRPLTLVHDRCSLRQEDPRLFVHQGRLCVSFTGVEIDLSVKEYGLRTSVLWAVLDPRKDYQPFATFYPHYEQRQTWEKNWSFFDHDGYLYAVYSIKPHTVLRIDNDRARQAYVTETPHSWTGGHLRGGAPPVLVSSEYWHFFHGRIGVGVDGVYNTGLYTFEAKPPFRVLRMTRAPFLWADPQTREQASPAVVFVGGAVLDQDRWTLSYGEHDQKVMLATYDRESLEGRMTDAPYVLPPVYCIYCEELPDRRHRAAAQFNQAGLQPRWWRGIHGNTWGLMTQQVYTQGECPITPGHASLILNHYNLWQHLYESGAEEAIICEDDVQFEPGFRDRAAALLERLPPDADLVFLGHTGCGPDKVRREVAPGLIESDVVYGTHALWIRRRALPVLLDAMRGLNSHVDLQLWERVLGPKLLRWYTAMPSLATQGSAVGLVPGSLGGSPWPGITQDLRDELKAADARLAGWCSAEKGRLLAGAVLMHKPKVAVEIGVYGGKSLLPIALALRHLHRNGGEPGLVYAIDPWTYEAADEFWDKETQQDRKDHREWWAKKSQLEVEMQNVIRCVTDFQLWPYVRLVSVGSEGCVSWFDDRPIDLLHIDGNHAIQSALRDVKNYVPRVREGGYVCMDDIGWETVQPAVALIQKTCRLVVATHEWHLYRKV